MSDEIKARLPFGPEDPWYEFVKVYEALPFRATTAGKYKEIKVHSELIPAGLVISSTFSDSEETGRVSFAEEDRKLIGPGLQATLAKWGWQLLRQGTDRFVFRKSIDLDNGKSTLPAALPLILERLGVTPNQDWLQ